MKEYALVNYIQRFRWDPRIVTTPTAKKKSVMKLDNISIAIYTMSHHLAEKSKP